MTTVSSPYVLVTAACNEAAYIERTICSVLDQTIRPSVWIIVNDASTDHTAAIVDRYASDHEFISALHIQRSPGRHFGNKVRAFNAGLRRIIENGTRFDYLGNLDADVSLEPSYFQDLLTEFSNDPSLGVAGGMVHSYIDGSYVSQNVALDSVAGAGQFFRFDCYKQTAGYLPLPLGGEDSAVEIIARMKGWKVRTFPHLRLLEHRRTGSSDHPIRSRIREGRRMHSLGYGLTFFLARCVFRCMERPRLLCSVASLGGFLAAIARQKPPAIPAEAVRFLRQEQRAKLRRLLWRQSPGT
jgi:poly-beta-1,6-N-acetyl-D-glucosamine synthase